MTPTPDRRPLLIALNAAPISRAALCRLARDLDAWIDAGGAASADLAPRLGIPAEPLRRALELRPRAAETAGREEARLERLGARILTLDDEDYPRLLRDLALPPPVLYCRGSLPEGPAVALVGSRRTDAYGREAAEVLAGRLAQAGVTVISGLARGIDSVAHAAAVATPGGRTIAVLGCGLDVDYPRGQGVLAREIADHGALVSEFPLGAHPRPWHFPIRNRVIAALADLTVVVQARPRSGSLITAHHALELGRDVFAVPGRIFDELSLGTNGLLADGASMARCPEDLLDALSLARQGVLFPAAPTPAPARPAAEPRPGGVAGRLLDALPEDQGRTVEELAAELDVSVDQVLGTLLELELGGWAERRPGPVYVR